MEQLVADFMALSYTEKVLISGSLVYMVVTTIYICTDVYLANREHNKYWKKEKWSLKKFLGFW